MYIFEVCPVTAQDIELWLDSIPNLSKAPFRREAYRKAYDIEAKIRAAKASGNWPPEPKGNTWESTTAITSTAGDPKR